MSPDAHTAPEKYKPFERFADVGSDKGSPDSCAFSGGTAPCPGQEYTALILKAAIDGILLSGHLFLKLTDQCAGFPGAAKIPASSSPPPSKSIFVEFL